MTLSLASARGEPPAGLQPGDVAVTVGPNVEATLKDGRMARLEEGSHLKVVGSDSRWTTVDFYAYGRSHPARIATGKLRLSIPASRPDAIGLSDLERLGVRIWRDPKGRVVRLSAAQSFIRDGDLQALGNLDDLEVLILSETSVGDMGLDVVGKMSGLRRLYLDGTHVTDAGIFKLSELKNLETLTLQWTGITGRSLEALPSPDALLTLNLAGTEIRDDDLIALQKLPRLESLVVANTTISDRGLGHLRGFQRLVVLNAERTKISDAGLKNLVGMQYLRTVRVKGCDLTRRHVKNHRRENPGTAIFF
ncbi:hypothetical protein MK489_06435 [Myxococcota bacterium]|nr:hypothetical protein [Myxococcota bacterium]